VLVNVGSATPVVLAFENPASYVNNGGCSPGALATLMGEGFVTTSPQAAQNAPLTTELNGVQVSVNGTYAPLSYVSETQITFQCPQAAVGNAVSVVVESSTGTSRAVSSTMQYATPGIFALGGAGEGQGAVLVSNTSEIAMPQASGGQPASPGDAISIYASGLGPVSSILAPGQAAPLDNLITLEPPIDVLIGGVKATVLFAGLAPDYAGLYQVNARVPANVPTGDAISLQLVIHRPDGSLAQSNVVTIAIGAPAN